MAAKPRRSAAGAVLQPDWRQYKRASGLTLGFHGCDRKVGEAVIRGTTPHLTVSKNRYDWLGDGIYFWEWDPWRAMQFAQDAKEQKHLTLGKIETPYVVGAIIDLGHCLNLMEIEALQEVKRAHEYLEEVEKVLGGPRLPENKGKEMGQRFLDRAVIQSVHALRARRKLEPYQSAKAAFIEGDRLYPGAGFHSKNHVQLAIRDTKCIRGYFRLPGL